jgi:hypothetical protein
MKTPQVMAWADALRSGEYKQHRGRRAMKWNDAYTAYGVLSELCPGWWITTDPTPSRQVYQWAVGQEHPRRMYLDCPDEVHTRSGYVLSRVEMTDLSQAYPFAQLGDLIEHFGIRSGQI